MIKILSTVEGKRYIQQYRSMRILVESEEDLKCIPESAAPGSKAHTAGYRQEWEKSLSGEWVEVVGRHDG